MFTYIFDGFLWRVFSLLRAGRILYIHNVLAWRHRSFLSQILSAFFTWSLGPRFTPSVHGDISLQNWFSYSLFPLMAKGGYFHFRILANHLASFFFPVRRLLRTTICPVYPFFIHPVTVQASVGFHSDPHSLLFPTGRLKLTYITIPLFSGLLIQTRRGRGHSLFLSSLSGRPWDSMLPMLSVDEILLLRYMLWSINSGLTFNDEMASFWLKHSFNF